MFCTHCGSQVPDDAAFCVICGQTLRAAPVTPTAPATPAAPVAAPVAPPAAPAAPAAAPVAPPAAPTAPAAAPGITGRLYPEMAVPPYRANPDGSYPPNAPLPPFAPLLEVTGSKPEPSPKKKKGKSVLMAILAVIAVLAIVAAAFWAIGGFDALFGNTGYNNNDEDGGRTSTTTTTQGSATGSTTVGGGHSTTKGSTTKGSTTKGSTTKGSTTKGSTTTTTTGSATASTAAPTTAPSNNTLTGSLRGGVYYNERFNLKYDLESGWVNGDALDYSAVETTGIDCGLCIKKTGDHVAEKLALYFTPANLSAADYATFLGTIAELDYASMGFGTVVTAESDIDLAGKMWKSVKVTVSSGILYRRYMVTEQNGYLIVLDITSPYEGHLNSLLYSLSALH